MPSRPVTIDMTSNPVQYGASIVITVHHRSMQGRRSSIKLRVLSLDNFIRLRAAQDDETGYADLNCPCAAYSSHTIQQGKRIAAAFRLSLDVFDA